MTRTARAPRAGRLGAALIAAALVLPALVGCAAPDPVGYGAADRAAMDALHAAGLRTAAGVEEEWPGVETAPSPPRTASAPEATAPPAPEGGPR